jgi:hypothetical protein
MMKLSASITAATTPIACAVTAEAVDANANPLDVAYTHCPEENPCAVCCTESTTAPPFSGPVMRKAMRAPL